MSYYRITVKFNQQNLGVAVNVYHFRNASGTPTDSELLSEATDYMEDIYDSLRTHMDSGCSFMSGKVEQVNIQDETTRLVGPITPAIGGTNNASQLPSPDAASCFARTLQAKCRGSKRFPGIHEGVLSDGLFTNVLLSALSEAVLSYIQNRNTVFTWIFEPGVLSSTTETWQKFSGGAVITNVPGTQVTRKPLRGA